MYSLLLWEREPFLGGVTYIVDWGGFSITAYYNTSQVEADAQSWEMFDHNGYSLSTFNSLKQAQDYAEYLYETRE